MMNISPVPHRSSFGAWVRKENEFADSPRTAATSLMVSMDESLEESIEYSMCPWEALDDSCVDSSSSFKRQDLPQHLDDISVSSSGSMDLTQCHHFPPGRYLKPCDSFHASYALGEALGHGTFGSVYKCFPKTRCNCRPLAVKVVPKEQYNREEIEILQDLEACSNVVSVIDVFHHVEETYIVMEELAGGELLDRIGEKECYSEAEAKVLFKTLLETVKMMHERGISHNDIKPENILLTDKEDDTSMTLVDFGEARRFRHKDGRRERMTAKCGSLAYAAPEVFNRSDDDQVGYDERADIYSCGVVLFVLLGGYIPFQADTDEEMIRMVSLGNYIFDKCYWGHISKEAKALVAKMMQVDPDMRCNLDEALASPWFGSELMEE